MILETSRLTLAPWRMDDWIEFRPIATDPDVMRFITGGTPWTDDQIQAFVKRQMELFAEKTFCRWKLSSKDSTEIIGFCGVGLWHDAPEIGWWLRKRDWGRGLATEAARAALQDVFQRTELRRIISIVRPANTASIRVMEKLGLSKETEFVNDGVSLLRYVSAR